MYTCPIANAARSFLRADFNKRGRGVGEKHTPCPHASLFRPQTLPLLLQVNLVQAGQPCRPSVLDSALKVTSPCPGGSQHAENRLPLPHSYSPIPGPRVMVRPSGMTRGVSCWWWVSSASQAWLPRVLLSASQELNTGGPEGGLSRADRAGSEVGGTAGLANRGPEVRMSVAGEDKGHVMAAWELV